MLNVDIDTSMLLHLFSITRLLPFSSQLAADFLLCPPKFGFVIVRFRRLITKAFYCHIYYLIRILKDFKKESKNYIRESIKYNLPT